MNAYYEDDTITLLHGNALELATSLPAESIQTIVTSPPYFGLRDYNNADQFGSEESVDEFVTHLVQLFAALRPALRPDCTLWLNLGDSYANDNKWGGKTSGKHATALHGTTAIGRGRTKTGLPSKNLMGVPWRVALALQADGWILRSEVIWDKPNPMPESVTDRPTKSHETLFFFAKSQSYYYDAAAIAEPVTASTIARMSQNVAAQEGSSRGNGGTKTNGTMKAVGPRFGGQKYGDDEGEESRTKSGNVCVSTGMRNKRDVWTVASAPFSEAHFAVYPPELIRPCILACSRPGDTVLDPFSGSGTTGMVATQEGRTYVGIDLNSDYLDLSLRTRFAQPTLNFGAPHDAGDKQTAAS